MIKEGDRVTVRVKKNDCNIDSLKKFNGQGAVVSKVIPKGFGTFYELEGFVTDFNIPYTFLAEHLVKEAE